MEAVLFLVAVVLIALLGATAATFGVDSATVLDGGERHAWI